MQLRMDDRAEVIIQRNLLVSLDRHILVTGISEFIVNEIKNKNKTYYIITGFPAVHI